MRLQLKASFTVEAAFVMSIIFFCLVTLIMFAYRCRDGVFRNYAANQAAQSAAYTEEAWEPQENNIAAAEELANRRLHTIGRYAGEDLYISRDEYMNTAEAYHGELEYKARYGDVENYMRLNSVFEDFADMLKEGEGE